MITLQDYECPIHGIAEYQIEGDPPDRVPCSARVDLYDEDPYQYCDQMAEHRISGPAVRTQDTSRRALTGHVRDTNKW